MFERMIQTAKRCLRKTIGKAWLTYEELLTSVVEVEMTLNSRPLSYVSTEDAEEPLTPSHLLCGHRILSLPDPAMHNDEDDCDITVSCDDLTRRTKHLNKTLNDFWKRWRTEYLLELRDAHRFRRNPKGVDDPVSVGDIVIVHDENVHRGLWKLGRVEKLITGTDGYVRVAAVKVTSKGHSTTIRRPVQRLYPLELRSKDVADPTTKSQARRPDHPDSTRAPCETSVDIAEPRDKRPRCQAFR